MTLVRHLLRGAAAAALACAVVAAPAYAAVPATLAKASKDERDFIEGAMASLNPYASAGKLKPFEGTTELMPGVTAVAAHGHAPAHAIYVVESKGDKLVLRGDLIHVGVPANYSVPR